ncbi:virion structural protein [Aeromonas phage D3]|uniref:Uncharacterized protein n=2 Tax=Ludhianavirus TaxID=3044751 RepID=A0A514TVP3_9CAUD|nr:virion structural protein [Aeromonas phage D3]YP_010668791.1 virion structural protein [Aeromonas phage D6]QDJ97040.1 hypothetical protein D3_0043 [Aeromonas phage D3]QDJ97203.1 hypothetical protein D6_0043 [Aeromonas phage D6]QEP52347.1 hypothetical protein D9_0140 [Aeromonas phage D9]
MSTFILRDNGINYPIPNYGPRDNLNRIMARNRSRFFEFSLAGNRVVENDHPLVTLLLEVSVDPSWSPSTLLSVINGKARRAANDVNLVTLYRDGINFPGKFFPEMNHNTLVVTSMDYASSSLHNINIASENSNRIKSLFPIMTNGGKHYWDCQKLIDTNKKNHSSDVFTILELDLPAFVAGYYWYLKDRIARNVSLGLSPHHYVFQVIMDMWMDYNDLVVLDMWEHGQVPDADKSPFAMENYIPAVGELNAWKRRTMMATPMKSFSQYMGYQVSLFDRGTLKPYVFTNPGKSLYYIQLSWVWTLANLYNVQGFLDLGEFVGFEDPKVSSDLKTFFKTPPGFLFENVKDPKWKKFFIDTYKDVKEKM